MRSIKWFKTISCGDEHWTENSRFDECQRIYCGFLEELVERERPNLLLRGGDIYDHCSTPLERWLNADHHTRVSEFCAEVIAGGNHDPYLDLSMLSRLRTRHPIHVVERDARVIYEAGAAIAVIAWPTKAHFLSRLPAELSLPDAAREAERELENVFRGLGLELRKHKGPRIGLGHLMISGAVTSLGQPLTGSDFALSLSTIALLFADVVIASHIHKSQDFKSPYDGSPILYTGSGFRTAFGELEEKSFLMCVFNEQGRLDHYERIPTPATPMLLLETRYQSDGTFLYVNDALDDTMMEANLLPLADEARVFLPGVEMRAADIRFRYHVEAEHREAAAINAAKAKADLLTEGALRVAVEETLIAHTRARMPGIVKAIGLQKKLEHFWQQTNNEPVGAMRAGILLKAAQLEEQALRPMLPE